MAFIRGERKDGYTIMSNCHLEDRGLSLKAKGMLSMMLALPDSWVFSVRGLTQICAESLNTVRKIVLELEEHGYIARRQARGEGGRLGKVIYDIYEEPNLVFSSLPCHKKQISEKPISVKPNPVNWTQLNTNKANTKESITKKEITKNIKCPHPSIISISYEDDVTLSENDEIDEMGDPLCSESEGLEGQGREVKLSAESSSERKNCEGQGREGEYSTECNSECEKYQSKSSQDWECANQLHDGQCSTKSKYIGDYVGAKKQYVKNGRNKRVHGKKGKPSNRHTCSVQFVSGAESADDLNAKPREKNPYKVWQEVLSRLEYSYLQERYGIERVREICSLLTETLLTERPLICIASDMLPREFVCERLEAVRTAHIQYVFDCVDANLTHIHNIKSYMLAALFNAPATISSYYQTEVNRQMNE